ncbi:MAG TPA: hypothetical protein VIH24_09815 [Candidatus Limnocylindria bacterium]|jgi:hypothetical protein
MSREERRAYQRQMKNVDRTPAVPAAAKARAERNAARRAQRRPSGGGTGGAGFTTRFWIRSGLIAVILGFLGFSVQWSAGMPRALYVGLAVTAIAIALLVGFRFLQRRMAASEPQRGGS